MSHELRTPMNAILGFTEMIRDGLYGEVPAEIQEPVSDIHTCGKQLLGLINNVLDLSKIEAGHMELALGEYVVDDVVNTVKLSLRALAATKGLDLVTAVSPDLPLCVGDGKRITQCLMNLTGNALKFTPRGPRGDPRGAPGERLSSRWPTPGSASRPTRSTASSRSSGRRTPPSAGTSAGPGWGSRSPASWSSSTAGGSGSRACRARARPSPSRSRCGGEGDARVKTVLYVEDNEFNRKIVRQLLVRTSYRLIEAVDGEAGVTAAREAVPDLIIMDIQLPKLSGLEATRQLHADPVTAPIPVIVITSFALAGDEEKAREAGAAAYLAKPYSPRELLQMIRQLVPES